MRKSKLNRIIGALSKALEEIDLARYSAARFANAKDVSKATLTRQMNRMVGRLEDCGLWLADMSLPIQVSRVREADALTREAISVVNSLDKSTIPLVKLNSVKFIVSEVLSDAAKENAKTAIR